MEGVLLSASAEAERWRNEASALDTAHTAVLRDKALVDRELRVRSLVCLSTDRCFDYWFISVCLCVQRLHAEINEWRTKCETVEQH